MYILICGLICSLLSACALAPPPKTAPLPGDVVAYAPKMQVGDRWKFKDFSRNESIEKEVVDVKANGDFRLKYLYEKDGLIYVDYSKDNEVLSKSGAVPEGLVLPSSDYIKFPLFVGKTYKVSHEGRSTRNNDQVQEYRLFMRVEDFSRQKFMTHEIGVFTISFTIFSVDNPFRSTGKILYSPELKSIIKLQRNWHGNTDLKAYLVTADELQQVSQTGALQPVPDAPLKNNALLVFGYDNPAGDTAALTQERNRLAAERAKLAQEKEAAEQTRLRLNKEAETASARKIAEAERLAAEKLASAEREAKTLTELAQAKAALAAQQREKQQAETTRLAAEQKAAAKRSAEKLAAKKQVDEGRRHGIAVIIGNKSYAKHNTDVPDVSYAHNDADAMYAFVKDTLGYPERNIILVKDATQAEMTSLFGNERNHKGKLFNWTDPESRLFVYYSGHGAPGLSDGAGYLLPVDADPLVVELNGYPLETLYTNLDKIPARQVTVVIDACFSGGSASGSLIKNASSISLRRVETKQMLRKGTVLTAADISEVASWDSERKMGLFTARFLDGVLGAADRGEFGNGDGQVRLGEMKQYLRAEVGFSARRNYLREQTPQIAGDDQLVMNYLH